MSTELEVAEKARNLPELARAVHIDSVESYRQAAGIRSRIKAVQAEINATFDPIITNAHHTHQEAIAQKKRASAPLVEAEAVLKPMMRAWDDQQERLRREEQARAEKVLRDQAIKEANAKAAAAAKAGDTKTAEEVYARAIQTPAVVIPRVAPAAAQVSYRTAWKFRIVDAALIPREYLSVNESAIRAVVLASKGATKIPGVEAYEDRVEVFK